MTIKNDGTWNMYRDIVEQRPKLEEDLRRLHCMLEEAEDYYGQICCEHEDLPGWEILDGKASRAFGMTEILLALMPGEAEKPD